MTPLTDADIARIKAENLAAFPEHAAEATATGQVYNCERCDLRYTCPFSMDPYNTGCDCLAGK
jgi:hypothetical protein